MQSMAISGFHASVKDADQLFGLYDKELKTAAPTIPESTEVLNEHLLFF